MFTNLDLRRTPTIPQRAIPSELTLRQAQLLEGAFRLLDRGGIDAVTMRSLAAEVSLSPMAAYKHFENQRELYIALWRICMDRLRAEVIELDAGESGSAHDVLMRIVRHFLLFAKGYPRRFELLFNHPVILEIGTAWEIESRRTELRDLALSLLAAGQRSGCIRRDIEPPALLAFAYATVHGASTLFVSGRLIDFTTLGSDEAIDVIVRLVGESIAPR